MNLANQAACKRCGRGMRTVAEIAPFGNGPGLIAFLCTECGVTASTLLYSADKAGHEQTSRTTGTLSSGSCLTVIAAGTGRSLPTVAA